MRVLDEGRMSLRSVLGKLPPRPRLYLATAIYGLAGGGIAVAFHQGIHFLYSHTVEHWAEHEPETFAWRLLALMLTCSLIAGWLVNRRCPEAAGSGIRLVSRSPAPYSVARRDDGRDVFPCA